MIGSSYVQPFVTQTAIQPFPDLSLASPSAPASANLWLKVRIDGKEAGCTPKSISVPSVARGLVENKSDWKSPRALA